MQYRYLKPGEVILPGDEVDIGQRGAVHWVDACPGGTVPDNGVRYRRRILPTNPQTLATPVTPGEYHNAAGQKSVVLAIVEGRAIGYVHPLGSPPRECSWSAESGVYTGLFSHAVDLSHRVEIEGREEA